MKLAKIFFVFLMLFLTAGATFGENKEKHSFSYTITQNGKIINEKDNTYTLDRDAFEINIKLKMCTGIYINFSEYKTMYDRAKTDFDFAKLLSINGAWMGGAEYNNNTEKNAWIQKNENRWQYWFIDENACRFNSVEKDGDLYIGKRTIENFEDMITGRKFKVKDSTINKLYVTITDVTSDSSYTIFEEHKTESFILEFK